MKWLKSKKGILKYSRIFLLVAILLMVFVTPVFADLASEVDDQAEPLLAGFMVIMKWAGLFGLVISIITLLINQDEQTGKKIKVAVVICAIAMAIGFAAPSIFGTGETEEGGKDSNDSNDSKAPAVEQKK